jgi:hypothetical protein
MAVVKKRPAPRGLTLVFLDIDGVMLPFGDDLPAVKPPSLFPQACLSALSCILSGVGDAELVLSSTWRAIPESVRQITADFRRHASCHGGGPLEKAEFRTTTSKSSYDMRQKEIHSFFQHLGERVDAWVVLDDEDVLEGPECAALRSFFEGHVVQTQSHEGLTMEQARRAVALLRRQQAGASDKIQIRQNPKSTATASVRMEPGVAKSVDRDAAAFTAPGARDSINEHANNSFQEPKKLVADSHGDDSSAM